jgi:subtilisin family serine protease
MSENYYYPAAYHLTNIISVAATDIRNNLLPSSNWGKKKVDIAAPGENIYSTLPGGRYGYMTGTSQATAFVTGVAALLLSQDPSLTPSEIKEIILDSADPIAGLKDKLACGGRVNAYRALTLLADRYPEHSRPSVIASASRSTSRPTLARTNASILNVNDNTNTNVPSTRSDSLFKIWE